MFYIIPLAAMNDAGFRSRESELSAIDTACQMTQATKRAHIVVERVASIVPEDSEFPHD